MKPPTPQATPEQQATLLWRQFTRQNQEDFWQKYDVLLQTTATQETGFIYPKAIPSSQVFSNKIYFKRSRKDYLYHIFMAIGVYLATPTIIYYTIPPDARSFCIISMMLALSIGILKAFWQFHHFEADSQCLYIYKKFFSHRVCFKWADILAIKIKEELKNQDPTVVMKIKTRKQTRSFHYHLPSETHEKFLQFLKTKVPQTYCQRIKLLQT